MKQRLKHSFSPFNPFARLGIQKYSTTLPVITTVATAVGIELIINNLLNNPDGVALPAIFVFIGLIVYFAFRDGVKGGILTTVATLTYYLYIIYSRNYSAQQLQTGLETVFILSILYTAIAVIIGWLKQTLDVVIISEVKAREAAEEGKVRLESVLDQMPVGVVLVDARNNTVHANNHIENILGRKLVSEIPDDKTHTSPDLAYLNGKLIKPSEWPVTRALQKGEKVFAEEMEIVKPDKKKIILRVNAVPIKNSKGEIVAAVSTLDNVTAEKEQEVRKDDFINMASHELKTPITSMNLYLELLERNLKKSKDTKSLKTLKSIQNQTERIQELINDLLDVSRIQTGKLIFRKQTFDLNLVVQESIETLENLAERRRIIFKPANSLLIFADRFRIYQVLTNLISNAIKYSPAGTDIVVSAYKSGSKIRVDVEDYGIGIEKTEVDKIFERLYQVADRTEKTFPGLGMGLYISKEIITRHKGKLWVESEKGKGSIFSFTLPLNSGKTTT